jgi:hypothetical protein
MDLVMDNTVTAAASTWLTETFFYKCYKDELT